MPAPTARVEGATQLRRALREAGDDLTDLKTANARVAAFIASSSMPTAPRRTGRLASTARGNRAVGKAVVMVGSAAVPYAGPIHWGWAARNIDPQPWVAETAERTEPVWLGLYEKDVDRIVDAIHRRGTAP